MKYRPYDNTQTQHIEVKQYFNGIYLFGLRTS